jgi:hypothetical protein
MSVRDILVEIDHEIARLQQAKALLSGSVASTRGRPKATSEEKAPKKRKKKRNISPEGRLRIAEAVKRRWAAQKKAAAGK